MIEYLVFGVVSGLLLGLIPGFHINNILPFFFALPFFGESMSVFIISSSIAFVFSSFFPAILLGAPNEDTSLSVLPGHRLVLHGKGKTALISSFYGALFSLLFSIGIMMFFVTLIPSIYEIVTLLMPYLLIIVLCLLIFTDKPESLIVVVLAGVLGFLTFDYNSLLPLLTGFFGLSTLIISIKENTTVPKQYHTHRSFLGKYNILRTSLLATFLGSLFNLLPAISSSITAFIGKSLGSFKAEEFLLFMGGTNMTYMLFSFLGLVLLGNTRSGSAVFLSQVGSVLNPYFILGIALIAGVISALLCFQALDKVLNIYSKINYRKISIVAAIFLIILVGIFTGFFGLTVLMASTSIGLLANFMKVRRTNCMSALIVPTIIVLL
jgi:putative membrane protein